MTDLFDRRVPSDRFSECGRYRYELHWPTSHLNDRIALAVLANPSKATRDHPDPTVTRWIGYCERWGFGWANVVNVRAWAETNPKLVPPDPLAIGPDNDRTILEEARRAELVVCGWGKLGGQRGVAVLRMLRESGIVCHALKLTKNGEPGHPLYLAAELRPFVIPEAAR